ncbi:hypothetical protein [Flaviaesturariibacter terrae]
MLELLTEYLSRTNTVTIPAIGSIDLERLPATWSVADQELLGPSVRVAARDEAEPAPPQLTWLAAATQQPEGEVRERLRQFGERLLGQLRDAPLHWPGVGQLQWVNERLEVMPDAAITLPPQAAGKVIREDALHTIRVGEQEVASSFYEERTVVAEGRHDSEWLAWLLVVLAALFIFYCVYSDGFSPLSSGLRSGVFNNLH